MHSFDDLMTPYGEVILAKAFATVLLGLIGFWHRQFVIARLGTAASATVEFWRLIAVGFHHLRCHHGTGRGPGAARSRRCRRNRSGDPTPAEILTGDPLPPKPNLEHYFTQWAIDPLWIAIAVGTSVAYVIAFINLRRRGDKWPVLRLISWLIGMVFLVYVTSAGPRVYGEVQFSAHMIEHMLLVMVVPLPMVLGAPITMLMRGTKARRDGSVGVREWVLWLVNTPYLRFLAHPIVASM